MKAWLHALSQDQASMRIIRFAIGVTLALSLIHI